MSQLNKYIKRYNELKEELKQNPTDKIINHLLNSYEEQIKLEEQKNKGKTKFQSVEQFAYNQSKR